MSKSLKTYKATKQKGDPHEQTENKSYRTKCVDENRFQALKIKG